MTDEQAFKEAHDYFTAVEFMLLFQDKPKEIVALLNREFPKDVQKLHEMLTKVVEDEPIARLLTAYDVE